MKHDIWYTGLATIAIGLAITTGGCGLAGTAEETGGPTPTSYSNDDEPLDSRDSLRGLPDVEVVSQSELPYLLDNLIRTKAREGAVRLAGFATLWKSMNVPTQCVATFTVVGAAVGWAVGASCTGVALVATGASGGLATPVLVGCGSVTPTVTALGAALGSLGGVALCDHSPQEPEDWSTAKVVRVEQGDDDGVMSLQGKGTSDAPADQISGDWTLSPDQLSKTIRRVWDEGSCDPLAAMLPVTALITESSADVTVYVCADAKQIIVRPAWFSAYALPDRHWEVSVNVQNIGQRSVSVQNVTFSRGVTHQFGSGQKGPVLARVQAAVLSVYASGVPGKWFVIEPDAYKWSREVARTFLKKFGLL